MTATPRIIKRFLKYEAGTSMRALTTEELVPVCKKIVQETISYIHNRMVHVDELQKHNIMVIKDVVGHILNAMHRECVSAFYEQPEKVEIKEVKLTYNNESQTDILIVSFNVEELSTVQVPVLPIPTLMNWIQLTIQETHRALSMEIHESQRAEVQGMMEGLDYQLTALRDIIDTENEKIAQAQPHPPGTVEVAEANKIEGDIIMGCVMLSANVTLTYGSI